MLIIGASLDLDELSDMISILPRPLLIKLLFSACKSNGVAHYVLDFS